MRTSPHRWRFESNFKIALIAGAVLASCVACRTTNSSSEVRFIGGHLVTEGQFRSVVVLRFGALCGATKVAS